MIDLTPEETRAIDSLKRLAKKWPDTLWLMSASSSLCVMKLGEDGEQVHLKNDGGVDPAYLIEIIHGIHNDGGDW